MALAVDTLPARLSLSLPQMRAGGRKGRAKVARRHIASRVAAFETFSDTVLSFSDGIESMEDVKGRAGSNHLFVSAIGAHPGQPYLDSLASTPYDESTIQVVSARTNVLEMAGVFDSSEAEGVSAVTLDHRCDNLSEIPVD